MSLAPDEVSLSLPQSSLCEEGYPGAAVFVPERVVVGVGRASIRLTRSHWDVNAVCHASGMSNEWSIEDLDRQAAKLAPERIRQVLAFAAVFQMTHEMIKSAVLDGVAGFYGHVRGVDRWMWGKERYIAEVLSKAHIGPFGSSLIWLVENQAITQEQAERLSAIYEHRHDLTHSLAKYVVYVDHEPDHSLLVDALTILRDLSRFWTQIEMDAGTFEEAPDLKVEDVVPLNVAVLEMCVQALFEGILPEDHDALGAAADNHSDPDKGSS